MLGWVRVGVFVSVEESMRIFFSSFAPGVAVRLMGGDGTTDGRSSVWVTQVDGKRFWKVSE